MAGDEKVHFWPSLYGRLAPSRYRAWSAEIPDDPEDDAADVEGFGHNQFFADFETLRTHVEVEVASLMSAASLEASLLSQKLRDRDADRISRADYPFEGYEEVRNSILNYGLPAFVGSSAFVGRNSMQMVMEIETRIRDAIRAYEPRIVPQTLEVKVHAREDGGVDRENPLHFAIRGEIRGADSTLAVVIDTYWDPQNLRSDARLET